MISSLKTPRPLKERPKAFDFLKNKRCFQDELTYLLNSQSGEVGDTLLHFVKTIMLLVQ